MTLTTISPRLIKAFQQYAAKHGFTECRQAVLGNGLGKVVVPNSSPPRQVYVRFGDSSNPDVAQVTLGDIGLPYADDYAGLNLDSQNIPIMVGRRPAVIGGSSQLWVVATDSTLAALSALGSAGTIINQIINNPAIMLSDATPFATGLIETDRVTTLAHPVARTRNDQQLGSFSAAAQPPDPVDSVSLIDRLRGAVRGSTVFATLAAEFDLAYYNGVYYAAYWSGTGSVYNMKHASTIAGLDSASVDSATPGGLRYPSILFDGALWHIWGNKASGSDHLVHYVGSSWTGSFTLADDNTPPHASAGDYQVRLNPHDGKYYCAYTNGASPSRVGIMQATVPGGPWTDLGLIYSVIGDPALVATTNEYDPTPIFWGGRAYMAMGLTPDGTHGYAALVELDPSNNYKAIGSTCVIANNTYQNPIFFSHPDQPGQEVLYCAYNGAGPAAGGISYQVGPVPADGRRANDLLRLLTTTGLDAALNIQATNHGGATWGPTGLVCSATPSGAYGYTAATTLNDFTLAVEFSISTMPGATANVLRASQAAVGSNPTVAIQVNSSGNLVGYMYLGSNYTITGSTVLVTGKTYRAVLVRSGSALSLYLNGNLEASGTQAGACTGVIEWSVANAKGATQAAAQQLLSTIYGAVVLGEAIANNEDPLLGLPMNPTNSLPTLYYQTVQWNNVDQPQESKLNFQSGSNTTVTVVDDFSSIRTDVRINAGIWAPKVTGEIPINFIATADGQCIMVQIA